MSDYEKAKQQMVIAIAGTVGFLGGMLVGVLIYATSCVQ